MATKPGTGSRSTVIRCPNCGEDYSVTYKRCPFCDEKATSTRRRRDDEDMDLDDGLLDEDEEEGGEPRRGGGKRLAGARRGGGYSGGGWTPLKVAGTVVSLAVIAAAIWIVVTQVMPLVNKGEKVDPTPPPASAVLPTPTPLPSESGALPVETGDPGLVMPTGDPAVTTPNPVDQIPSTQTATSFTLNREDFTMAKAGETWNLGPKFVPAGSTGFITWTVDKPQVATVSDTGVVTAVGKGTATVTATMAGGFTKTCIVRVNAGGSSTGAEGGEANTTTAASASLNRSDFSFSSAGETFKMKVSGASGNPVWAIGDSSVATIGGDGTVTAVAKGTTTITCTVDGQTLKCIVRCQF